MSDLIDSRGEYFTKAPGADSKLDFSIDWTSFLTGAETLLTSNWTVPAGINQATPSPSIQGNKTIIWLDGGTAGVEYELLNKITTSDGRKDQRYFRIRIVPYPTLASNALITIDYLKTFLRQYSANYHDEPDNQLLGNLIDSSSEKIERYCRRRFKTSDYVERVTWGSNIFLKNYPIHYVSSIHRSTRSGVLLKNNAIGKDYATAWI